MDKIGLFQVVELDQREWRGYSWCRISFSAERTSKFKKDFPFLSAILPEAFDIFYTAFTYKDLGHRLPISFMLSFQFLNSGCCTLFKKFLCSSPLWYGEGRIFFWFHSDSFHLKEPFLPSLSSLIFEWSCFWSVWEQSYGQVLFRSRITLISKAKMLVSLNRL